MTTITEMIKDAKNINDMAAIASMIEHNEDTYENEMAVARAALDKITRIQDVVLMCTRFSLTSGRHLMIKVYVQEHGVDNLQDATILRNEIHGDRFYGDSAQEALRNAIQHLLEITEDTPLKNLNSIAAFLDDPSGDGSDSKDTEDAIIAQAMRTIKNIDQLLELLDAFDTITGTNRTIIAYCDKFAVRSRIEADAIIKLIAPTPEYYGDEAMRAVCQNAAANDVEISYKEEVRKKMKEFLQRGVVAKGMENPESIMGILQSLERVMSGKESMDDMTMERTAFESMSENERMQLIRDLDPNPEKCAVCPHKIGCPGYDYMVSGGKVLTPSNDLPDFEVAMAEMGKEKIKHMPDNERMRVIKDLDPSPEKCKVCPIQEGCPGYEYMIAGGEIPVPGNDTLPDFEEMLRASKAFHGIGYDYLKAMLSNADALEATLEQHHKRGTLALFHMSPTERFDIFLENHRKELPDDIVEILERYAKLLRFD